MPHEITSEEIPEDILARTLVVYTKRSGDFVKYKLRTKKTLYTYKVLPDQAEKIETKLRSLGNVEIVPL
ncbi:MAG: hypothetical protein ACW99A_06700 [Candidatus Kariarchaeaceae archaeon]|jgi:hypothetical protein